MLQGLRLALPDALPFCRLRGEPRSLIVPGSVSELPPRPPRRLVVQHVESERGGSYTRHGAAEPNAPVAYERPGTRELIAAGGGTGPVLRASGIRPSG